jgi:hypothetical protein
VSGTPTFLVNAQRHDGAYDIDTLWQPSGPQAPRAGRE